MTNVDEKELKVRLYRSMLRIRMIEEAISERYPEQNMRCPVHLSIGQEAAAVGACDVLKSGDRAYSGHRSHGHYLARGGDLKAMIAEIYGKSDGCTGGFGGSMHLVDEEAGFNGAVPIVGATIPIGVGSAFASHLRGLDQVTMIFFGDGACETGVFHESVAFAALHDLPVVFLVENNLYSVYSPLDVRQQAGHRITTIAEGHGVKIAYGDGNDVMKVRKLAGQAVEDARAGKGPTLLEFSTYRWREHCGPNYDNDIGYRTPEEFEAWKANDPVASFASVLTNSGIVTPAEMDVLRNNIASEIDRAFAFAAESSFPSAELASSNVYASSIEGRL
jgi:TPP-dependent pyruvate/acetoin dehydrogenase alpha subunit